MNTIMNCQVKIAEQSDSLIAILSAQCEDLEKLLDLSREQLQATQNGDFESVMKITSKRSALGDRLETYRLQITEIREHLGANAGAALQSNVTARIVEIANLTLIQDRKTTLLLTGNRETAANELAGLEKGWRGSNAYLREETRGLSINRTI